MWPGGYRCDACGGPLTHTDEARAHELPEEVWRQQRVDYGARRGMVFRFLGMFIGACVGLYGLRAAFGFERPWSIVVGVLAVALGVGVWKWFHEAAHRGVRIWVLRKGQVQKKKLARALLSSRAR